MKVSLLTVLLFCWSTVPLAAQTWDEAVAGTGVAHDNGNDGPAGTINIGLPFGVEIGPDRALYVTEVKNHRIRRIDLAEKTVTTVAGCGRAGYAGDGGPAIVAQLNEPYEIRFDSVGNMYVVEMRNHVVRRIDARSQRISTVAGQGRAGFMGDGSPAVQALLNHPHSIALDGDHALYIADIGNHRVRRVDLRSGIIDTVAGNGQRLLPTVGQKARGNPLLGPRALFIRDGILWIALREGHSIWRMSLRDETLRHVAGTGVAGFSGDGGAASAATFNGPKGLAVAANGTLYIADSENHAVRRIDSQSGIISTVPGPRLSSPHGICVADDGAVFVGDTLNHRVLRGE